MIALAWALACSGSTGDTGATDTESPPAVPYLGVTEHSPEDLAEPINWTCVLGTWTYEFAVVGVSGDATLHKVETNARFTNPTDELHSLTPSDIDPEGWWTRYNLELLTDPQDPWVDGATTNAACEGWDLEAKEVSWHLVVNDPQGERADCAVWGEQPMSFGDSDCYIW